MLKKRRTYESQTTYLSAVLNDDGSIRRQAQRFFRPLAVQPGEEQEYRHDGPDEDDPDHRAVGFVPRRYDAPDFPGQGRNQPNPPSPHSNAAHTPIPNARTTTNAHH